jgi:chondroitin-sulfate-ABC endolyase/exolyase
VKDGPSGIVSAAVFEEGAVDSMIVFCSQAMVMYSIQDGQMTLSVANPDLAMYQGESDEKFDTQGKRIERSVYGRDWIDAPCAETTVKLTLEGLWEFADLNGCNVEISHDNRQTMLTFKSKEARTEEITLKKITL